MLHFHDPLAGCLLEPAHLPGLYKLLGVPPKRMEDVMLELGSIPGVQYQPHEGAWFVPANLVRLGQRGACLSDYTPHGLRKTPSGLELFEYQRRTVSFITQATYMDEGVIVGAAPSAGKTTATLQALSSLELLHQKGIVVGPHSSIPAWCGPRSDCAKHFGLSLQPAEGTKTPNFSILQRHTHIYVHYDLIHAWYSNLVAFGARWIIFDESHKLLHSSKRAQDSYQLSLCPTLQLRVLLSGSPIPRDRLAFYHQLAIAQPHQWQKGSRFRKEEYGIRYLGGQKQDHFHGSHIEYTGPTHEVELLGRLTGVFLRYTQDDFAQHLPRVEYHTLSTPLPQNEKGEQYRLAETDILTWLRMSGALPQEQETIEFAGQSLKLAKKDRTVPGLRLRGITECRKLLAAIKVDAAMEQLPKLLEQHAKFVVFTWKVDSAEQIVARLTAQQKAKELPADLDVLGPVTGKVSQPDRDSIALQFWESARAVFVGTMDSSGISINELGASMGVLIIALHWTSDMIVQAILRVRRLNNPHPLVRIYILVVTGTIDEHLLEVMNAHAREDQALAGPVTVTEGVKLVGSLFHTEQRDTTSLNSFLAKVTQAEAQEREY